MSRDTTPLLRALVRYAPLAAVRERAWSLARRDGLHRRPRPFTARTRHGFRLAGDQSRIMPRCLYWFGHWEPLLTAWLRTALQPGDTFVDVGANMGYFSLLGSRAVGPSGRVVALEPSSATRRRLEENLERNRARNVRVLGMAAGAAPGEVSLYRAPWNDAETSTVLQPGLEFEERVGTAPVLRLLSDEDVRRLRVVKVDVEGAERAVLEGLEQEADRLPERMHLVVEVHASLLARDGATVRDLVAPFRAYGFEAAWLPVDFSEEAHLHGPSRAVVRHDEIPLKEMVHLVLSR